MEKKHPVVMLPTEKAGFPFFIDTYRKKQERRRYSTKHY